MLVDVSVKVNVRLLEAVFFPCCVFVFRVTASLLENAYACLLFVFPEDQDDALVVMWDSLDEAL